MTRYDYTVFIERCPFCGEESLRVVQDGDTELQECENPECTFRVWYDVAPEEAEDDCRG